MGAATEQPSINLAERLSLGVEETATVVGCSPNYIRNLIRVGKLPHSRLPSAGDLSLTSIAGSIKRTQAPTT
jgi:hypothetical protein